MEQFKKRKLPEIIAGAGGKKSSGSSRTPVEADDTVNSNVKVSILDLLGEGVIGGLKDGAKSIFLNDLPLQNSDDTYNHSGVTWWFRDGSQDQSIIEGFDYTETPKTIGLQVKKTSAVTMAVDSDSADRFRVILKFPSLKSVDKKTGDTSGTSVTYKFQVSSAGGAFVDVAPEGESSGTVTLTAKKAGVYYRSYMLNLPKPGSKYQVRVVRVTDDNKDTTYLANDIYVDTVGEIINTNMNYPNSALVGLRVNSEQFGSSMPSRSYLISGMKIRVPSNYDEVANEYQGTWDGSFKLLSSSNPAWILYDLVTNKRYGLGEFVRESMFDLGQLYQIGRYCDALVDDGFGGKEKRFAINTQITTLQDAYRCVQDIAGAFRGMVYWAGGMVHVTQDSPSDPIAIYSNSNVIDGRFSYKGSARKDRPSVALITYNNKEDNYKQNIEYVEDLEAIKRYGIRKTESVAFGCTSRGMAHRVGLWTLYTGRMESDVITFQTGMDSAFLVPGDVILIHDKFRAGRRNSGRVVASTANSITLDSTVDMTKAGTITFINAEGRMISRDILESGVVSKVTFKDAVNEADRPVADGIWVISQSDLKPLQARVVGVTQGEDGVGSTITCIQNNPSKYAAIDDGAVLIPQNTTVLDPTFSKPENLKITEGTYLSSPGNLNVSLTAIWEGKSAEYWVSWRRSDAGNVSNWQTAKVNEEQFEVKPVAESGKYDFQVYGVSVSGRKTEILSTTYQVLGTMTPPGAPSSLTAVGDYRQIILGWSNPSSVDLDHIQIYASKTNDVTKATLLAKSTTTNFTHSGLEDSVTWYYWIRSANKRGMTSDWSSKLGTSAMTRDVLSFLQNKITESELAKDLLADIDSKAVAAEVDASIEDAKSEATAQVEAAKKEASSALSAAQTTLNNAIKQEATDRNNAVADEAKQRSQAISAEADARTKAISDEAIARADAITKESDTRTKAMADEVIARNKAVADEAAARTKAVSDEAVARAKAVSDEVAARTKAVADEATARAKAISDEAAARATAISDSMAVEATARAKAIADSASSLSDKIEKEVTDRAKAVSDLDTKTANAISSESSSRIAAISDEAKTRADAILQEKNSRQAEIKNVSAQMQTANESLAQQISQVAAGTGEQFDSLKIWYFDAQTTEGWSGNKGAILSADGWIRSGNGGDTWLTSPAGLAIAGASYRFMKLRIRKVGNPVWEGAIRWITKSGDTFNNTNFITVSEPEYNAQGVATLTASDIKWNNDTIHQIRLDLSISTDDSNYIEVDWIAVGRPTPGAGMAALQDEKTARTNADASEAASRSTLATQLRGSYDGTDITKLSSGLIFQEQQARVTADKVEATARQSLETKVNDSVSSINKSLDTLNTKDQAMASDITGLKSSLDDKADASAVQTLKATVEQQGSNISTQGQSITKLQGDLNTTNTNVGKKADQTAMTALQGTVTQQGKDIAAANSSISTLKSSLDTTNDAVAKKADATAVSDLSSRVSATEGSVSSQGDSIVQLNNSLSNALADSDASAKTPNNLIVNPSFERGMDGYIGVSSRSTAVVIQVPHVGTKALKVDPGSSVAPGQYIDFVKDRTYEIGVWVKQVSGTTDNGQGNNKLRVGNSAGSPALEIPFVNITTDWMKVSKRWKATETGSLPVTLSNYLTAGNRYFDDFYVIDVTDTVNIDASASAISSLQSTVTQQGKDISSQSTSIAGLNNSLNTTNENVAKKADSSAVQTLQNTVTQQGKDISTANSSITSLKGSLDATNDKVATKADSSAVATIQSTVTQQGKDIASSASDISSLKNSLATTDGNVAKKADASALQTLQNTVTQQGKDLTSVGNRTTTLENSLKTTNDNVATKADASALSSLQNTVTQQGKDVAANTSNITALSNQVVNGKQDTWARRIYKCQLANAGTEPTFSDIQGLSPVFMDEVADAAKMDFSGAGSYVVAHYKAMVRVAADTTISVSPGSRVFDDSGAVYVNGVRQAAALSGTAVLNFTLSAGWNTVEFLVNQWTGNAYVNLGFKLGDKVAELYSGLGVSSLSSALNSINSNVSKVGDQVSSNSTAITSLKNGLSDTNSTVAKKADATALQTLQNTVTQQGKDIASQSDSVTNLSNALNNVSIGGVNLINNSGDMTGWSGKTNEIFRGNAVISATSKAGSSYRDLKEIILDAPVDNAEYVYSFFAKGGENGQSMTAYFYNPNSTISSVSSQGVSGGDVDGRMSFTLTTEWVRYWVKWKQKPGTGSKKLILARIQASSTKDQTVSITSPKLEVGNMPTEWSPAPSDMASSNDLSSLKTTVDANSGAIQSVTSRVQKTEDSISTQNTAITKLQGDLSSTNNLVSTKADSTALQTLSGRVDKTESSISTQNDAITKLNSSLDTTNKAVAKKAEQSSLDTLSGRVSSTENGITAANSSITSLNAAIRAENASSGDLITNPTFDPQYAQMGFTVVSADTDGVPANCPFRYAAKLAARDHHPNFNTIVATLGDVFEISALVACGAGNADFNLYIGTANGPTGGIGGPLYNGGNTKATSTWTRVTWKFTVSQAMVDKGYIRPFLQINQSSPFGTIWYVTDWHMRNITAASKAQDTANATSKAVDSLTSTVNQQGSDISSIGSRTTSLENGLSTTNANVAKKADSSALQTLQNSVTQQGNDISGQGSRVTSLENNLTAGANLIPNPAMLNGAQGWAGSATTVDGYAAVVSSSGWSPSSSYFQVTPGDIIDLSLMSQSEGAASISWGLRFDGPGLSNFCLYAPALTFAAGEKKSVSAAITVPAGATKAMFQASAKATSARTVYNIIATRRDAGTKANSSAIDTLNSTVKTQGDTLSSIGSRTTSLENGLSSANSALSLKADASALSSLTNTVTQQGKDLDAAEANIIAANTSITSMQASLTRRTVFTVTAKGNGNSANHGLFDESGKSLFTPGRSYALITFKANSDGSTVINTSKTYDVFGSANNGKAMSDDIAALANGVYVCVMTYDEPSGQRNSIASALELLGGTTEVINSLPYRGAYILLGRKGMKAGDGLELRAPTGGDSSAFISTSVEFVNGVMMGLGAAGGVMMKADANASAITTLQNTVKQQGDTIASSSSAITSLQNDMRTVNDNVSKKADASALQTLQNTVTQQGKDISTQSASLTQLNNSLSATNASIDASGKIPGNLIVNSSFERDKDGYTGWSSIASVIAASVPHSGSKILKLAAGGSVLVGQDVTYLKGRTYKIGAWAKQDSGTVIQAADNTKFRIADSTGLLASSVYGPFTSNWQEISFTWRPGKDVTAATQITAYLSAGAMYFDDFYVIDITDRVDLDATVSAVSGLTTRVSNAEGNISSQSDSITTLNNGLSTLNKTVSTKADATALSSLQNTVTQQGKDISSASGSITSLQSSLNTIKVQSNPWIDGTFETYDNGQQLAGSSAVVTTDFSYSGSKCLRATRPANASGNSDKSIGSYSVVRQSAKYRVEFWVMMPASETPPTGWTAVVGLHAINKDGANDWQGLVVSEAVLGGRDKWAKVSGIVSLGSSATRAHVWISTRGLSGSGTPGYNLYIDDFVITDVTDAVEAQSTANANADAISSLQTKVGDIDGKVTAQASQLSSLSSKVDSSSSKVDQMSKTLSDSQSTQASLNTSLQSQIDAQASANIKNQTDLNSAVTSIATIKSTQATQATQLSAIAKQQTDMTASLNNQSASIQTLQESVANNDSLKSTWMVKMETNSAGQKYAAGIALGVDGKSQQSQFLVQADRFALINTSNGNTTTPFVIDNGVTYMNSAYIKDGAITDAKIANASISSAKIAQHIQSDNYIDGQRGWAINKNGAAQFNDVVVRGTIYATDGWFNGTVYANRVEGDIGSFAINIAQHRTRKVPKATWQWFELARFRRQNFDQVINIRGGLIQTDSITIDGGAKLRAGMSYSPGADGGLDPGYLSYAMLLRGTGATSGGGSMEIGIELAYETGGATRLLTAQASMDVDNMSFVVPAGSGDAILRYGCYLDRNGQMVLTILSRFDAFAARNNNVVRGSSTP
ncbi:DUF1983 domain-containing protein [Klebsiella pneumoniae]|uniref:phage tail tip fiber protein n=1 Tax=Klebsiella TaxID=570 RepID=UPI001B8C1644|nr:phage tail protein [Klebsiella pneumoniae]MBQ5024021.1 DUF1983 domain-containing protein [Klebsiella pneumoniae]